MLKGKIHLLCVGAHFLDAHNVPSNCRSSSICRMNASSSVQFPVRSLEKGGNILGTVLSLNLGKILRYIYT